MVSVGIDVSKEKSMVCIIKSCGKVLKTPYEMEHTIKEIDKLVQFLKSLKEEIRVVMESTGIYHLPVVAHLLKHEIFVSVINPYLIKKYSSVAIRAGKTDKIDAIKIANFGISYWLKLQKYKPETEIYEELRVLSRQYYHYMDMKIKARIALGDLLAKTMPKITSLIKLDSDVNENSKLLVFVEKYWHYDNISRKKEKQFIKEFLRFEKEKGYRQGESKAKEIYEMSQIGIPTLKSSVPSTKILVKEATRVLKEVSKTLELILIQMQKLCKQLPEFEIVREMKGVGKKLAPRLIAEIGDVRKFENKKALVAYAGIDVPPFQSGNFCATRRKISKRGNKYLRKTGYEIMQSLKTHPPKSDSKVYDFIIKKENQGKQKKQAKIAGLNKFLHIYFARVTEVYRNLKPKEVA